MRLFNVLTVLVKFARAEERCRLALASSSIVVYECCVAVVASLRLYHSGTGNRTGQRVDHMRINAEV